MMFTIEEQKQHRKEWVEALRSGKYEQGRGSLREGDCYCCLGVACDIAKLPYTVSRTKQYRYGEEETTDLAPAEAMEYFGLTSNDGILVIDSEKYPTSLANLNDFEDWSFEKIADLIEKEPEGLFVDSND